MSLGRETARLALTAWMAGRGGDGMAPDDPARLREDLDACRGALDAARRDFIAAMNHELRTPLNAILGFAQLLEMSGLTDEQRQSLRHVLKGGRHLLQLVNELLDISQLDAGSLDLSPEAVGLDDLLVEVADLMHPAALDRDVRLEMPARDGLWGA